jgi:SsrA-binding protein
MLIENKNINYNYFIEDSLEVGIQLRGWEVKSIKANNFNFSESFVRIVKNELFVFGMHVKKEFSSDPFSKEQEDRDRKLLLHKHQIESYRKKVEQKGFTLVLRKIYTKDALIKAELCLVKGKKLVDKRNSIKERDLDRKIKEDY